MSKRIEIVPVPAGFSAQARVEVYLGAQRCWVGRAKGVVAARYEAYTMATDADELIDHTT
jgi:hypothetical protein